jgi:hypothetical protein
MTDYSSGPEERTKDSAEKVAIIVPCNGGDET